MAESLALRLPALPVGSRGRHASGWWGMWTLIATEGSVFAYLLFSYFYVGSQSPGLWPPDTHGAPPALTLALPNTIVLLVSSAFVWWGERGLRRGQRGVGVAGTAIALLLGIVFVAVQGLEWSHKHFTPLTGVYGSLYFTITGFHIAHVVVGLLVLIALLVWSALGYFGPERHSSFSIGALYWHFVDAVWLVVFATIYISPRWFS